MDALGTLAMTAFTPSSAVPLAAQSREPEPYSCPRDHQRRARGGVRLGGVVDEAATRRVGLGEVAGVAALDAVEQLVAQPDVGERAADP